MTRSVLWGNLKLVSGYLLSFKIQFSMLRLWFLGGLLSSFWFLLAPMLFFVVVVIWLMVCFLFWIVMIGSFLLLFLFFISCWVSPLFSGSTLLSVFTHQKIPLWKGWIEVFLAFLPTQFSISFVITIVTRERQLLWCSLAKELRMYGFLQQNPDLDISIKYLSCLIT